MNKSESIVNVSLAISKVMFLVQNIEKNMTIGSGQYAYKGVADKDVKLAVSEAMIEAGLVILPVEITPKTTIDRWEESGKTKQSCFVEVSTKYLIIHADTGEYIEVCGYGHGVDTQDKAAGKATTYALKYALLYSFMIATGSIDDADNTHSDNHPLPPKITNNDNRPWLNEGTPEYVNVAKALKEGYKIEQVELKYKLSKKIKDQLLNL
mgnify:CR=1 FL=1